MTHLLRLLIRTLLALLFVAFGSVASFAAPGNWLQVAYSIVAQDLVAQSVDPTNAARAPPTTIVDVMTTGTALAQAGDLLVLDGSATTGAVYAFSLSSNAPNTATRGADGVGSGTVDTGLIGDGQSFARHGTIGLNADGSLPTTTVPEGTFVTVPVGPNRGLRDGAGQLIESGDVSAGMAQQSGRDTIQFGVDRTEGATTYLPGSEIPNYELSPPGTLSTLPGSQTVQQATPLSELLQPNMGCVNWAACTEVLDPRVTPGSGGFDP